VASGIFPIILCTASISTIASMNTSPVVCRRRGLLTVVTTQRVGGLPFSGVLRAFTLNIAKLLHSHHLREFPIQRVPSQVVKKYRVAGQDCSCPAL
jgi:hypothetical protein